MGRVFNDVLEDCVQRLKAGESARECVERYPEYRDKLTPLLQAAAETISVAQAVTPGPGIKERGLNRLTAAVVTRGVPKLRWYLWLFALPRAYRMAAAAFTIVVLGSITVLGTNAAAADSLPGDPLYWVKTTRENIALMMPKSNAGKAEAHAKLANVRTEEMTQLVEGNKLDEAEKVWTRIEGHLQRSARYAGVDISATTIEMPGYQQGLLKPKDALKLKNKLVEDVDTLKAQFLSDDELIRFEPHKVERVELLRRRVEMRYRWIIGALERNDSPGWRQTGIVEPTTPR